MKFIQLTLLAAVFQLSQQVEILSKIINGNEVSSNNVSYQVQIRTFRSWDSQEEFQCTGSLISNRHVITARHCVGQKLPSRSDANLDITGKTALVSGWGRFTNEDTTDTLREVEVTIAAPEICGQYFRGYDEHTQICFKVTNEQAVCEGDSGGPLVIDGKLFGVTTGGSPSGASCTGANVNVFVRITSYLDWIRNVTGLKI